MVETMEYRLGTPPSESAHPGGSDNGSCDTAKEIVVFGKRLGLQIRTTPAYSPESNRIVEAFIKTLKKRLCLVRGSKRIQKL